MRRTPAMNRPLIRSRFPSRARKNEGAPMVSPLIILRCRGVTGYGKVANMEIRARSIEKMFFTRKRAAAL